MALAILGEGFDLHGGGDDLVFPHHENERAQAEAAGHDFARYWVHSGMVTTGGEKMSKSLQNFITLQDALDVHDPRAFRLAVLQSHYRSQQELGTDVLTDAGQAGARLDALVRRVRSAGVPTEGATADAGVVDAFGTAMDDDFGTPQAVAVLFDAVRAANQAIDAGDSRRASTVRELTGVLGIELVGAPAGDAEVDARVQARTDARARGAYGEADRIRDELAARGITLEDTPHGTIWHR
jgi:cysteinyl-tRNA synthetase